MVSRVKSSCIEVQTRGGGRVLSWSQDDHGLDTCGELIQEVAGSNPEQPEGTTLRDPEGET